MNDEQIVTSQRRNRTKEHIRSALIKLIKEKGYHSVTVKDIVDCSAYNRSTFYVHYQDKDELAAELLATMLQGLVDSIGASYAPGQRVLTAKLNVPSFNIVTYLYEQRDFFELVKYEDTLPGLHIGFPNAILKIYNELFIFETIDGIPVNMDYFKRYTAYGFYGLVRNWIENGFRESRETFIHEVIELTKTHMHAVKYIGK